jgi:hypothetical protein
MIIKDRLAHPENYSVRLALLLIFVFLSACSSSGGSASCDTVANPDGPAFFRVENNLSSGLSWTLPAFAFGADMKPGEWDVWGLSKNYGSFLLWHQIHLFSVFACLIPPAVSV